jgi:arginyl-tRNA synthetase
VSLARVAKSKGISADGADVSLLTDPQEQRLILKLLEFPHIIDQAITSLAPHKLALWAHKELAQTFHPVYDDIRVLTNEISIDRAQARLMLYKATQIVLQQVLDTMGMNTPHSM